MLRLAPLHLLILALALTVTSDAEAAIPTPLEIILAPEGGNQPLDHEILDLQMRIKAADVTLTPPLIEKLGWVFVAKARLSNDPGYYKLAESSAAWLEANAPHDQSGMLLRGHILDAMHRFHEAEAAGRELVKAAPLRWESFALLGDALMELGRLPEAVEAYQKMVDIRPCAQTYMRVGHVRWLKGDLDGALETALLAVEAGSTRDPEPAAWAYTRLAFYQWQNHDAKSADWSLDRALQFVPRYAPALLACGKMLLSEGKNAAAVDILKTAERENPLPEYLWALADAQRAAGLVSEAEENEAALERRGAMDDPRTYSLFLSTRKEQGLSARSETALKLAQTELQNRGDIFTQDAVAWAFLADGKPEEARVAMRSALAEGTQDGRLLFHAAVIARAAGATDEVAKYSEGADALRKMLLPSESSLLHAAPQSRNAPLNATDTRPTAISSSSKP